MSQQRFRPSPAPIRRAGAPLRDLFQTRRPDEAQNENRAPPVLRPAEGTGSHETKRVIAVTPQCFASSLLKLVTAEHLAAYEKKCRERAQQQEPQESTLFFVDTLGGACEGGSRKMDRESCTSMQAWFAVADRVDLYTDLGVTPFMKHLADHLPRERVEFELLGEEWASFLQRKTESAKSDPPAPARASSRRGSRRLRPVADTLAPDMTPIDTEDATPESLIGASLAEAVLGTEDAESST